MAKRTNKPARSKIKIHKHVSAITVIFVIITVTICAHVVPRLIDNIRKDRAVSIFDSLKLDDQKYTQEFSNIDGENNRFDFSSGGPYFRTYIRGADVDETVAELKKAVAGTDFKIFKTYDNSSFVYKSSKNELLQISVSSMTYQDDFYNKFYMGVLTDNITTSMNAGPSNVSIHVYLEGDND